MCGERGSNKTRKTCFLLKIKSAFVLFQRKKDFRKREQDKVNMTRLTKEDAVKAPIEDA